VWSVIGIGIETADLLVREILSRNLRDRRALARYAGLTGRIAPLRAPVHAAVRERFMRPSWSPSTPWQSVAFPHWKADAIRQHAID